MIKAQNQFTKVKEKEDVEKDLKEKLEFVMKKIDRELGEEFFSVA